MKRITIYQEKTEPVIVYDNNVDDSIDDKTYENNILQIMTYSNVCKINIDDTCIIIRPSKITSIKVEKVINLNLIKKPKTKKIEIDKELKENEEKEIDELLLNETNETNESDNDIDEKELEDLIVDLEEEDKKD